jgi:hypothetical protein
VAGVMPERLSKQKVLLFWKGHRSLIALRKKIPPFAEILALYATIVFLIYGWAILAFFWKVPSWLYYLSLTDILAILSYALASSFVESAVILLIFLLAALSLPSRWLADKFIVRGSLTFCILTFWMALFNLVTMIQLPTSDDLISFGLVAFLTIGLAIFVADRLSALRKIMTVLSDRLTIFLYLWLPLSAMAILILIVRLL